MESLVVPMILAHRQEYFVTYSDLTMVSGQNTYDLPTESIALGLRKACVVEASGEITTLEHLDLEKVAGFNHFLQDGFYFLGNKIVFYPTLTGGKTVRLYYHRDPNEVVATSDAAQITAIDTGTNTLTFTAVPTDWETSDTLDVIRSTPGFNTIGESLTIAAMTSTTITVSSVDDLQVGDWVALEGFSPIAQIPKNAFKIVEQAAAIKCLEAMGANISTAEKKLENYIESFGKVIAPRNQGGSTAVTANGMGIFQTGIGKRFRAWSR